jgi:hypothetical protein
MTSFQLSRAGAAAGAETSLKLRAPFSFVRMKNLSPWWSA